MKRLLLVVLFVLAGASSVFAQDAGQPEKCSPADIQRRVDSVVETFHASPQGTQEESLAATKSLKDSLQAIITDCAMTTPASDQATPENPGQGTLTDPYRFGVAVDTGEGFTLKVTRYIRPADQIIANENMFNDRPEQGEVYIIIGLELTCIAQSNQRCESNYLYYELTGDQGIIYEHSFVVYEDEFDVSVFGGAGGTGDLVFLVRADDTNLRLMFQPGLFDDEVIFFEAEPSADSGIQIQADGSINVRSGPSTNASVVGSMTPGVPVIAFGRNGDGTWLQIAQGWVFAELITTEGDIQALPITSQ
jgi:hypothetical protein